VILLFGWLLMTAVVAALAFAYTSQRRRERVRRQGAVPHGFVRTDEVNIDPTTGVRQRVWYNPYTGERYYETLDE
jgi:hypothetical protein